MELVRLQLDLVIQRHLLEEIRCLYLEDGTVKISTLICTFLILS